jgi:hypothetical protein
MNKNIISKIKHDLIRDVISVPIKKRPNTGILEIKISENQTFKAVGVICGFEHIIKDTEFDGDKVYFKNNEVGHYIGSVTNCK